MNWRSEIRPLLIFFALFALCWFMPVESGRVRGAVIESLALTQWYAREHVLLCLVPAFFIAGAIGVFVRQAAVMKYLGPGAPRAVAYGVASVSGGILAVCSCTVLPLFAGIYRMGAGLGPASAFLYAGPAINVLAVILTAAVLGPSLGFARAAGAVVFSVFIGLAMHFAFRREEAERKALAAAAMGGEEPGRPLWKTALYFAAMIGVLVFANWGRPMEETGLWFAIFQWKWKIAAGFSLALAAMLGAWFGAAWGWIALGAIPTAIAAFAFPVHPEITFVLGVIALIAVSFKTGGEMGDWMEQSWGFAKQILPLLLGGVLAAGLLLGRPGHEGLIPSEWVARAVGGEGFGANFFASLAGALMYFATLTEVPIVQGLTGAGMGKGPSLALLLAGPALSLPSMLVIRGVLGTKKTAVYIVLVVAMATMTGMFYGMMN